MKKNICIVLLVIVTASLLAQKKLKPERFVFSVAAIDHSEHLVDTLHGRYGKYFYDVYSTYISYSIHKGDSLVVFHTRFKIRNSFFYSHTRPGDRFKVLYKEAHPEQFEIFSCMAVFGPDEVIDSSLATLTSVNYNQAIQNFSGEQDICLKFNGNDSTGNKFSDTCMPAIVGNLRVNFCTRYLFPNIASGTRLYVKYNKNRPRKIALSEICDKDSLNHPLGYLHETKAIMIAPVPNCYFSVSLGDPGLAFFHGFSGQLYTSFPYSVSSSSGGTSTPYVFQALKSNVFSNEMFMMWIGTMEYGTPAFSIKAGYGGNPSNGDLAVFCGYGRNFVIDHGKFINSKHYYNKTFGITASLNLNYYNFSSNLGSINNQNQYVYILNSVASPSWNTSYTPKGGTTAQTTTWYAQNINVNFNQYDFGLSPKISIGNNLLKNNGHFEISVSYFVPLYETGGLSIYQVTAQGDDHTFMSGNQDFSNSQITARYNNVPVNKSPFNFNFFYIEAGVAVSVIGYKPEQKVYDFY